MTPIDWTNLSRTTGTFIQQTFDILPSIASVNDPGVLSVASKSSSSKSCTLPSLTSTKHSRLSTPSLSSSDGKGKRPLSFSPLPESLIKPPSTTEIRPMPIVQHKRLTPLIEPNEIQCRWAGCDLVFSTPVQLTEHIRSVHIDRIDSRTWSCQWQSCSRHHQPFKSLYSLFTHLRTHTQDRPYQCSFIGCTKTFTRAEYLRLHERSHTGEKPYPCEYPDCSKAFSNPSDRTKHVKRTHLNKKEYICQFQSCNKSYTDPSSLRKHVKTVHGEDAFRQKKHKRTDENHPDKRFEESKENISNTISFDNFQHGNMSNNFFDNNLNNNYNNDDDDEDIIVDQDIAYNVDVLGDNLGELTVGTAIHRLPMVNSLKNLTKKAVLPAIHITGVCDVNNEDELMINQVAFRKTQCHRISAHSASTAYSSMRSDSMNVESALFLPSNHSSMISSVPHPSASPYEYDCNVLQLPSPHSPLRRSQAASVNSSIQTADLSSSNSLCVSALSGDIRPSPTNTNPKMAHLLYFLQSLEYENN